MQTLWSRAGPLRRSCRCYACNIDLLPVIRRRRATGISIRSLSPPDAFTILLAPVLATAAAADTFVRGLGRTRLETDISKLKAEIEQSNECPILQRSVDLDANRLRPTLYTSLMRRPEAHIYHTPRRKAAYIKAQRRYFSSGHLRGGSGYNANPTQDATIRKDVGPDMDLSLDAESTARALQESADDDKHMEERLKGRGLHRAWQIQGLITKQMAMELLFAYLVKHGQLDEQPGVLDELAQDLQNIRQMLKEMQWTRRLDSFGVNYDLEEEAASRETEAHASRESLDIGLINHSQEYSQDGNLGNFIDKITQAILFSPEPPSTRSLAMVLYVLTQSRQLENGEIVLQTIRRSLLPFSDHALIVILGFYAKKEDGASFIRFVSFMASYGNEASGFAPWRWTKIRGQTTVPIPPNKPTILSQLICTALATGRKDQAKAWLKHLLDERYGLSHKIIWSLMLAYSSRRDWASGQRLLQQICLGKIPLTPEATSEHGLKRICMGILILLRSCRESDYYGAVLQAVTRSGIEPWEPGRNTILKGNWAQVIVDWEEAQELLEPSTKIPEDSTEKAKSLFRKIASILDVQIPTESSFRHHNTDESGSPIPSSISVWKRIKESVGWENQTALGDDTTTTNEWSLPLDDKHDQPPIPLRRVLWGNHRPLAQTTGSNDPSERKNTGASPMTDSEQPLQSRTEGHLGGTGGNGTLNFTPTPAQSAWHVQVAMSMSTIDGRAGSRISYKQ